MPKNPAPRHFEVLGFEARQPAEQLRHSVVSEIGHALGEFRVARSGFALDGKGVGVELGRSLDLLHGSQSTRRLS